MRLPWFSRYCVAPVSYTHLDVYKRQDLDVTKCHRDEFPSSTMTLQLSFPRRLGYHDAVSLYTDTVRRSVNSQEPSDRVYWERRLASQDRRVLEIVILTFILLYRPRIIRDAFSDQHLNPVYEPGFIGSRQCKLSTCSRCLRTFNTGYSCRGFQNS